MNIFKMERRYGVFDEKTYSRVISLIGTMTTYTVDSPEKKIYMDIYFDNQDKTLEKSELLLRKRVCGKKAELKIKRRYFSPQYYYSDNLRSHEREKEIGPFDSLSKHFFFLNNALNSMFSNTLQFDPDKMFERMNTTLIINVTQERRVLYGYGGLKVEIKQEKLKFENKLTNRKNKSEIIQFRLLSKDNTLPLFEDFCTRVEKHCKEIFYTQDSKYEIAFKMTKPLPSREERARIKAEILKKRLLEESGEKIVTKKE